MPADLKIVRTPAEEGLLSALRTQAETGEAKGWAAELRAEAGATFERLGLPHRRLETWKWTDLRQTMQDVLPHAKPADAEPTLGMALDADRAVFVNGHFVKARSSLPDSVEIARTADLLNGERDGLAARIGALATSGEESPVSLNTAFMTDGIVLRVAAGARLARPLHIAHVFTGEPAAAYLRHVLIVEDGAEAEVTETFEGADGVVNSVTEVHVGAEGVLRHSTLQDGGDGVYLGSILTDVQAKGRFDHFVLHVGARLARHQIGVVMAGEHAELNLAGASLLRGKRHADTSLVVTHAAENGVSRETFATVLEDKSRGVFQGKIIVPPHAQKTDGQMMTRALFLSDEAEFDAKPELEIYADDVLCAHGATSGQIDADHLFYLMARGIPRREAESILVSGFIEEAVEAIATDDVREVFSARAQAWLSERSA